MVGRRAVAVAVLLLVLVPISSLLGLLRPVVDDELDQDWGLFGDVWQANFWGDLVFTVGTIASGLLAGWLAVRGSRGPGAWRDLALAIAASFLAHWLVYAFAWSFTITLLDEAPRFWGAGFRMFYDEPLVDSETAWGFVMEWGWPGLVFAAVSCPAAAWFLAGRNTAGAKPTDASGQAPGGTTTRPAAPPSSEPFRRHRD